MVVIVVVKRAVSKQRVEVFLIRGGLLRNSLYSMRVSTSLEVPVVWDAEEV